MKKYVFVNAYGDILKASQGDSGRDDIVIYDNIRDAIKSKFFSDGYDLAIITFKIDCLK